MDLIYHASNEWLENSLLKDRSIFKPDEDLWTISLLDELDKLFVKRPDLGKGSIIPKLKTQLHKGSDECKKLMAECLWLLFLFPAPENIGHNTKRDHICHVWSWSGVKLDESHLHLRDTTLDGIGSAGSGFNYQRWRELGFLISALRDFKKRSSDEQNSIVYG